MDLRVTIDDLKTYTKPWTLTLDVELIPDSELLESICNENDRDVPHLMGK